MHGYLKRCKAFLNHIPVSSQKLFTFKVLEKFYVCNTVRSLSHLRKYSISQDVEKTDNISTGEYPDESAEKDPFMKNEIKKYNTGKHVYKLSIFLLNLCYCYNGCISK